MNEASYLMLNEKEVVFDQCVEPLGDFHSHTDLQIIRGFLDETEVAAYETIAQQVRREMKLDQLSANVGHLPLPLDYKYIMHHKGRYDVWNIQPLTALSLKRPPQIESASCLLQSLGFLFVDPFVIDDGKWHQDAVELFPSFNHLANTNLPPFYYTVLVALTEQKVENAPTHFHFENENRNYWVPLQRGDALIFPGTVWHRGSANHTSNSRDMLYATYTPAWYNEEKL